MSKDLLNLFYREPDSDRWLRFDRYPRRLLRKIIRGNRRPSGQQLVAINLMKGLNKINVHYRFNDFSHIRKNHYEIACVIGKPELLLEEKWYNPLILGASIFSHPVDFPKLDERYPIVKRILVPGPWIKDMFEPFYGDKVVAWPVGIDTEIWSPGLKRRPEIDFLIYDKVRWEHDRFRVELIEPLCRVLKKRGLSYDFIRYGFYEPSVLLEKVSKAAACIFLCEHETQGLAYQQILATGTPVMAWDRGGYWQDPYYYPKKVAFSTVSSVPYWDERCGVKFKSADDFEESLDVFEQGSHLFAPQDYIQEHLTLEICARRYVELHKTVQNELS